MPLWMATVPKGNCSIGLDLATLWKAAASCDQELQSALEEAKQPQKDNVFIPECANGGLYKPVQCHPSTGYCWCVLVDTGRPIPGTSTRYEQPKCDNSARAHPSKTKDLFKGRQLQGPYLEPSLELEILRRDMVMGNCYERIVTAAAG
ncbi:hypothetical protein lerEdw1_006177 [Lerista edwardsae]|nr:hypothetical protein lerEdw1_006177 [Lerista edwardsae]